MFFQDKPRSPHPFMGGSMSQLINEKGKLLSKWQIHRKDIKAAMRCIAEDIEKY